MAKSFKLRLSKLIPLFLLCRSKHPDRLHTNPLPISNPSLSPINRKSFDIYYPSLPNPPPSTPISYHEMEAVPCSESNDGDVSSPLMVKNRVGKKKGATLNVVVRSRISSSSGDSGWFSSDEDKPLNPSRNLSNELDNTKSTTRTKTKRKATTLSGKNDKASTFELNSGIKSVAIEKRSKDPFNDFKDSMMEMIMEKEIVEVRDLEDLLQCFLSLNSRQHHKVIVEAFTEIWDSLFSSTPQSDVVSA